MGAADLLTTLRGQAHAIVALPGLLASADELLDSLRATAQRAEAAMDALSAAARVFPVVIERAVSAVTALDQLARYAGVVLERADTVLDDASSALTRLENLADRATEALDRVGTQVPGRPDLDTPRFEAPGHR